MDNCLEQLGDCCNGLVSSKIQERKRSLDTLSRLMYNQTLVNRLHNGYKIKWDDILYAVHKCLEKEAERLTEDMQKKVLSATVLASRKIICDNITTVIRTANQDCARLSVTKLIEYIYRCFDYSDMRKHFSGTYLSILKNSVLSERHYWSEISLEQWLTILSLLKRLIKKPAQSCDECTYIECLYLVVKHGPENKLQGTYLRQEFGFIAEVCTKLSDSNKLLQENILHLLLEFCKQMAKDCRVACCKLGEETFWSVKALYEPNYTGVNLILFEYFLLQMALHHPGGAIENTLSAYAVTWSQWYKCINSLYGIICNQINKYVCANVKSSPFLITIDEYKAVHETFLHLSVEVLRQVFMSKNANMAEITLTAMSSEQGTPNKRLKLLAGTREIINTISTTKNWPWINVITRLLKTYPDLITCDEFLLLLQALSEIQVECKNEDTRYHTYECLIALIDVQKHLNSDYLDIASVNLLWNIIWQSSLKAAGLNHHDDQINRLLQKLMIHCKIQQPWEIFKAFFTGVPRITEHNLQTLNVACQQFGLNTSSYVADCNSPAEHPKVYLMKLILANENVKHNDVLTKPVLANTLVSLCLKQWPKNIKCSNKNVTVLGFFSDTQDIFRKSSFEGGLLIEPTKMKNVIDVDDATYLTDVTLFEELTNLLRKFSEHVYNSESSNAQRIKQITTLVVLYVNVVSYAIHFEIVSKENVDGTVLYETLELMLKKLSDEFCDFCGKITSKNMQCFKDILKLFEMLFEVNVNMWFSYKLRGLVPIQLLQQIFMLLNQDGDNLEYFWEQNLTDLKKMYVKILCKYCCVPSLNILTSNQKYLLEAMLDAEFNEQQEEDCDKILTVLNFAKNLEVGALQDGTLTLMLKCLEKITRVHYSKPEMVLRILDILCNLYKHLIPLHSTEITAQAVNLLFPFFECKEDYGPKVSVVIINCCGILAKLDPDGVWAKWEDDYVPHNILHFVSSNYQEVRLCAAENLVLLFETSKCNTANYMLKQRIFEDLYEKCIEAFKLETTAENKNSAVEPPPEMLLDETVTRTSSVLHSYAVIVAVSNVFRSHALFNLFKITNERSLSTDSLGKIIELIAVHLRFSNGMCFLESYMCVLIQNWYRFMNSLEGFPFTLFGCQNEAEFLLSCVDYVVPLFMEEADTSNLQRVSSYVGKSVSEIVEDSFSKIMSDSLLQCAIPNMKSVRRQTSNANLMQILSKPRVDELVLQKLNGIVVNLVENVYDMAHFKRLLPETNLILNKVHDSCITVDDLFTIFKNIQENFTEGQDLISYCTLKQPAKIQNILLQLSINIETAQEEEDKIKAFCHYVIIVDMVIPLLKQEHSMQKFLLHSIICTFNHLLIKNFKSDSLLHIITCKYLSNFILQILNDCVHLMQEKLLVLIMSTLVRIARQNSRTGELSMKLLNTLVLDKTEILVNVIKSLDPFPSEDKFNAVQAVYENLLYGIEDMSLEDAVWHFLKVGNAVGNVGYRGEGLKHLRKQLALKKEELKVMYGKLRESRGFSEDARESVLHQLICMLIKLTSSDDSVVSLEAAGCLGELGPADLTTMVLYTEPQNTDLRCTPFELFTGHVTALFANYIFDRDVKVIQEVSTALREVIACKEGRIVSDSDTDYGRGVIEKWCLIPFISSVKVRTNSQVLLNEPSFRDIVIRDDLWCPQNSCSHSQWITNLVCSILDTISDDKCYLRHLIPVCKVKVQFAEYILPPLINLLLHTSNKSCTDILICKIQEFFEKHWIITTSRKSNEKEENLILLNKKSVKCMLDVVNFVRLQNTRMVYKKNPANLDLNYLHVAQAAQFCSAHFSVLLYVELWAQDKLTEIRQHMDLSFSDLTMLDVLYQNVDAHTSQMLQKILKKAYTAVGELDALHGCGTSHLSDVDSRIEHFKLLGRWDEVVQHYDIQISRGLNSHKSNLLDSLKNSSLFQLPLICQSGLEIDESQYECMWRLGKWDLSQNATSKTDKPGFESLRYEVLKSLHDNNDYCFKEFLRKGRLYVIDILKSASLESCKNLYRPFCLLQSLQELEDFSSGRKLDNFDVFLKKWNKQDDINRNEFQYVESIRAQRITMMRDLVKCDGLSKSYLFQFYLDLANLARSEGCFNVASHAINNLRFVEDLAEDVRFKSTFEEAQLYWAKNDRQLGKHILRQMLNANVSDLSLKSSATRVYGMWMAETHSQSSQAIINDYFLKSLKIAESATADQKNDYDVCETYHVLAKFADKEYQQLQTYSKSSTFQRKVQNLEKSQKKSSELAKVKNLNIDERKAYVMYERQAKIDEQKIQFTYKEKDTYIHFAVKYYLLNLEKSDKHNMCVFRMISLWLENRNNAGVLKLIEKYLDSIPTYKFISILPQLIPHITSREDDVFGKHITQVVKRCAQDHPHHTLPLILALINSNKDRDYADTTTTTDSNESRMKGAQILIRQLIKGDKTMADLVERMQLMVDALVQLAYLPVVDRDKTNDGHLIPSNCKIRRLKNLDNVLVPTYSLPVRVNCDYSDIVGIVSFSDKYNPLDGINAPKRIKCRGTDGIWRPQLVKGRDDMRQDAVMQQVFTIMNGLLASDKQTKRLLIRTYKIVPLSMRSGILEWVDNSMRIGDYLVVEDGGAHFKYNKRGSYTPAQCRARLKAVQKSSDEEKLRVFKDICKNLDPVFHKFFVTSFPQPCVWYERRRAYMRSVATSSMCGYILGIGDRHVSNILIDRTTAEVVHIDFGIAFEQGLVLPTPETVPFRLTRDMEDGMGASGVEGVFRRSCEKTMELLRRNSETIITILEVLLYDPLYSWTVTPAQAYSRQQDEQDSSDSVGFSDDDAVPVNVSAERALLKLREKLQGIEDGCATSVEGQVEKLLQQARDPNNLCKLFNGWQAYL